LAAAASGTITTVAGNGKVCSGQRSACGDGGPATDASLSGPYGVWVDPSGQIFIADGPHGVREVRPDGTITTAGGDAYDIRGVVGDTAGELYATANNPDYLVKIDPARRSATTVVGTGTSGYNGNTDPNTGLLLPGTEVQINHPEGLSIALGGDVVFTDTANDLIRAYVPGSAHVIDLGGMVSDGTPQGGFNGDGHFADATKFDHPQGVAVTRGVLFVVADSKNQRVREFGPDGTADKVQGRGPLPVCRKRTARSAATPSGRTRRRRHSGSRCRTRRTLPTDRPTGARSLAGA
jgi:NHL repeat